MKREQIPLWLAGAAAATTVVSIGHRSTLEAFHQRNVVLTPHGDRFTLQDRVTLQDQAGGSKP